MKPAMMIAVIVLCAASALAQVHGVPASVTSITPTNRTPGVAASVTSLGPHGYGISRSGNVVPAWSGASQFGNAPHLPPTTFTCSAGFCAPTTLPSNNGRRHHQGYPAGGYAYGGYGYGGYAYAPMVPVYTMEYGTGSYADAAAYEPDLEPEPPAPTIFERRPTTRPYARDEVRQDHEPSEPQSQEPLHSTIGVGGEDTTTLVFRDGHQMDIHNYAIVSGSIFNFDGTGPFKTQLADLDVPATVKLNEDRGIIFKVPSN